MQQPIQSYRYSIDIRKTLLSLTTKSYSLVAVKAHILILARAMETPLGLVGILEDGDEIDADSIS